MSVRYRPDIDGLRAVAIIPVILYHFGGRSFPGGYVGVDVFFVISGFLIASLIHNEIHEKRFSLWHFYERRIRRIFPALFFLVFATGVLAYAELFPWQFYMFAKSVAATSVFLSNVEFWREGGYFELTSIEKPLLHNGLLPSKSSST